MASSFTPAYEIGPNFQLKFVERDIDKYMKKGVNVTHTWNISNFNRNFESSETPIFTNGRNVEWLLKLEDKSCSKYPFLPRMDNFVPTEDITYCLKLFLVSFARRIRYHCKFQLLSTIPKNTITWYKHVPYYQCVERRLKCFEIKRDVILNYSNGFLHDNGITIICDISAVIEIPKPYFTEPKCTLHDDFEGIFENEQFTDFTFYVAGKEFHVHKAILAARSPVFEAMFQRGMKESKNRVELSKIKAEVFREILRFIYAGRVRDFNEIAIDLLQAAILYRLKGLKLLCIEELSMNISVENAVEVFILANLHSLDQLKDEALDYIVYHGTDVIKTDGWDDMIQSHPELLTDLLSIAEIQFLL